MNRTFPCDFAKAIAFSTKEHRSLSDLRTETWRLLATGLFLWLTKRGYTRASLEIVKDGEVRPDKISNDVSVIESRIRVTSAERGDEDKGGALVLGDIIRTDDFPHDAGERERETIRRVLWDDTAMDLIAWLTERGLKTAQVEIVKDAGVFPDPEFPNLFSIMRHHIRVVEVS